MKRGHFLLLTVGTAGDVHPFIGIGQALRERGHEVTLATNAYFEKKVLASGLSFEKTSEEDQYLRAIQDPRVWHPRKGMGVLFKGNIFPNMAWKYRFIAERYQPGRTVVVAHGTEFSARIAQEKLGLPLATISLAPSSVHSDYETPDPGGRLGAVQEYLPRPLRGWLYRRLFPKMDRFFSPVNHFRAELGLPPVQNVFHGWKHSPQLALGLWPEWFAAPQPDWPGNSRATGFVVNDGVADLSAEPAEWQRFIDDIGRKPIVFTAGTGMAHGQRFFEAAAEACYELQQPGLLLAMQEAQIPRDLPPYVRHLTYASFDRLLPRAAAIVHHGGIGTSARGLAAGIPQVIVPHAFDQFDNAKRLDRLGVGRTLRREDLNGTRLAWQLGSLLASPKVAARCARWAEQMRGERATERACDELEWLVGTDRQVG